SRTSRCRPHAEPAPRLRHRSASMRGDGAGAARRRGCNLAFSGAVSQLFAQRRAGARRPGSLPGIFECAVRGRLNAGNAQAGAPVSSGKPARNSRALSVLIESEPKLQILVLTRFLPQISLRNLRKLDCYANRYPLHSKTLEYSRPDKEKTPGSFLPGVSLVFQVFRDQKLR